MIIVSNAPQMEFILTKWESVICRREMERSNLASMPVRRRNLLLKQYLRICRWWNASGMPTMDSSRTQTNVPIARNACKKWDNPYQGTENNDSQLFHGKWYAMTKGKRKGRWSCWNCWQGINWKSNTEAVLAIAAMMYLAAYYPICVMLSITLRVPMQNKNLLNALWIHGKISKTGSAIKKSHILSLERYSLVLKK